MLNANSLHQARERKSSFWFSRLTYANLHTLRPNRNVNTPNFVLVYSIVLLVGEEGVMCTLFGVCLQITCQRHTQAISEHFNFLGGEKRAFCSLRSTALN